jgi:hypothetical protein
VSIGCAGSPNRRSGCHHGPGQADHGTCGRIASTFTLGRCITGRLTRGFAGGIALGGRQASSLTWRIARRKPRGKSRSRPELSEARGAANANRRPEGLHEQSHQYGIRAVI